MITINQITPAKNSVNVPVNQDLEIRISADFKLDPRNISFKLNDVDIIPNVFSVYNGETDYELVVTLYTRKRIKFGENFRYGQADVRYGMRDIHPSVLEYGARYVCSFIVWGINNLNEREELTDSFVFNTEEGIFYNQNPVKYFYSDYTQSMANKLPEWAKGRYDKYSNFQQILNPIGEILEKTQDFIDKTYQANFLQTANLKELSCLYKYELEKNFEFKNFLNQDGSLFFVQPEISGIQGITRFDLFASENNDIKSLYYEKIPTRINVDQVYVSDNVIFQKTIALNTKHEINAKLEREGSFVIYCEGVQTSVYKNSNNNYVFLKCKIKGVSLFDKEQKEEIVIYDQKYLYSKKMWKKINSIEFFNIKNQFFTFEILHFPKFKKISPDTKRIISFDGTKESCFWYLENREDFSVLQKRKTLGKNAIESLRFAGKTELVSEVGLYDIDNVTPLRLIDIAVDYNSNYIYGITEDYLYIFDKREPYPTSLKEIPGTNGDADFLLSLEYDECFLDENREKEILINCIHSIPGKKILKYRIKITKPNKEIEYLLPNETITTDINNSAVFVNQKFFTLDDINNRYVATIPGEYIFELETLYQGGSTSKDYAVIFIKKNCALAKYKLERILNNAYPTSIFIDYDQQVKIYTSEGILQTLIFHKDGIVIDYVNKILYSSEEYTSLDVE